MAGLCLLEVLAEVPDPRSRHGRVTLGEDGCRVRQGSAPPAPAAVRNAVIHLLTEVEADSRAAASRRLNNHPEEALDLLSPPAVNSASP